MPSPSLRKSVMPQGDADLMRSDFDYRILRALLSGEEEMLAKEWSSGKESEGEIGLLRRLRLEHLHETLHQEIEWRDVFRTYALELPTNYWPRFQSLFDEYFEADYRKGLADIQRQHLPFFERTELLYLMYRRGFSPSFRTLRRTLENLEKAYTDVFGAYWKIRQSELEIMMLAVKVLHERKHLNQVAEFLRRGVETQIWKGETDAAVDPKEFGEIQALMSRLQFSEIEKNPILAPVWLLVETYDDWKKVYSVDSAVTPTLVYDIRPKITQESQRLHRTVYRSLFLHFWYGEDGKVRPGAVTEYSKKGTSFENLDDEKFPLEAMLQSDEFIEIKKQVDDYYTKGNEKIRWIHERIIGNSHSA